MDTATGGKAPGSDFPEERLLRVFEHALRNCESDEDRRQIVSGAFSIGYRRGLLEGAPPLQPEDLEAFAHRFTALAGRMRWMRDGGTDPGGPLEINTEEEVKIEVTDTETGEVTVKDIPDDHPLAKALNWIDERAGDAGPDPKPSPE
jgi:hypothetical protein